jgi:hypothetical protein
MLKATTVVLRSMTSANREAVLNSDGPTRPSTGLMIRMLIV